jgi:hypothetical protein
VATVAEALQANGLTGEQLLKISWHVARTQLQRFVRVGRSQRSSRAVSTPSQANVWSGLIETIAELSTAGASPQRM